MSMNPEHLDAYISGELRDDSACFIESAIRRDEDLQEEVYRQAQIDQALRWLYADGERDESQQREGVVASAELEALREDEFIAGVMASVRAGDERSLARSVLTELLDERQKKTRPGPWWDLAKAGAVAAVAVLATVLVFNSVEVRDEEASARREAVEKARLLAQITRESDAMWGESSTVDRDGDWLGAGLLHLESGVAEVTFDNGARVILEGPTYLDIETPQRAYLRRGRLTAEVPPPAVGFVINTPSMNVVDLGTRFGIDVQASGTSELHVMEGQVEASRSAGGSVPLLLREGLAVRADQRTRSRLQPIEYAGDRFALRAGEAVVARPPRVHFRFDETVGSGLEDSGSGFAEGPFEASLVATGETVSAVKTTPRRSAGRVGSGLVFQHGQRLSAAMPSDLGENSPHLLACWVKLPPKSEVDGDTTILSLGPVADSQYAGLDAGASSETGGAVAAEGEARHGAGAGWQLRSNAVSGDGPLGALRVEYGDGFVIGTTDLRDGRWHHVAYRLAGGGSGADVATHVRLFVDGHLEPIGAFRGQPVNAIKAGVAGGDDVVFLNIGTSGLGVPASFEGSVDEVILCVGGLDPATIYQLATQPERRSPTY